MAKKGNKYKGPQAADFVPEGINAYLGLGRPFEFDSWLSRIAILATVFTAVGVTFWRSSQGMESYDATMAGVGTALGFLFSFMIARELDPDRRLGGIIGGVLTVAASVILGEGNILVMLWLLFILRMFTRTSGDRHRIADNVLIIGSAFWLGKEGYWLYPLLTGAFYVLESQISEGYFRSLYLAGIALASAALAEYNTLDNSLSFYYIVLMGICFIVFIPELRVAQYVHFKGDKNDRPINPRRLQTAQGSFLLLCFIVMFFHGDKQALALLPAVMAAIGCGIYLFVALLNHEVDFNIKRR